jgi:hypothetical protein
LNAFARKFFKHKRNGAATYTQKPQNLMKPQRRPPSQKIQIGSLQTGDATEDGAKTAEKAKRITTNFTDDTEKEGNEKSSSK